MTIGPGRRARLCPIALIAIAIAWVVVVRADQSAAPSGYALVWSDEFGGDGPPDAKNWTYEQGFVRNDELQWYQPANVTRREGQLVIEARRERVKNPEFVAGSQSWQTNREYAEYTSSSVTTNKLQQWQYGRFEIRGRIDTRLGMWPAFWTLGVDGEWPDGGEIDIMEFYRGILLANVAWGSNRRWVATWDASRHPVRSFPDRNWASSYHVWRMDWDARAIDLYVDDRRMNHTDIASLRNPRTGTNPFHAPHYFLISLAIGGWNGGDPAATQFPARLEVDYVRVYQARAH